MGMEIWVRIDDEEGITQGIKGALPLDDLHMAVGCLERLKQRLLQQIEEQAETEANWRIDNAED